MNTITSKTNHLIKKVKRLLLDSQYRKANKLFVVESYRVINTFLTNQYLLDVLLVSQSNKNWKKLNIIKGQNVIQIPDYIYQYLSELVSGDGLIAMFRMKEVDSKEINKNNFSGIILDHIQNPNNFGAILRSAKGFDIKHIFVSNGSVDLFNPKVIQSSMGIGYDINIRYTTNLLELIKSLQNQKIKVLAACCNPSSQNINKVNLKNCCVVLGNEGNGIKSNVISQCNQSIYIPLAANVDSLNLAVAASIIMYQMKYANYQDK